MERIPNNATKYWKVCIDHHQNPIHFLRVPSTKFQQDLCIILKSNHNDKNRQTQKHGLLHHCILAKQKINVYVASGESKKHNYLF